MCGIAALLDFSGEPGAADRLRADLTLIEQAQLHRGPDGQRTQHEAVGAALVGLAFQRLSILDLADAAMQPMTSACGNYTLIFNGEIYNYRELRSTLDHEPSLKQSSGDTAVLLALLLREGASALARLVGMWSLVLLDRKRARVLVARDRMGVKPLYWHFDAEQRRLAFASEAKSLLMTARTRFKLSTQAVARYLLQSTVYDTHTSFFEGIERVPPAHYAWIELNSAGAAPRFLPYWAHPFESGAALPAASPAELRSALLDAVRLRLRSDVPMGLLLSGGLDSSVIAACVKELGAQNQLQIFSAISSDPASNEEPHIDRMAAHIGVTPHKIAIDAQPEQILRDLPETLWHNEAPLTSLSMWAFGQLMQAAKERGVTVLLSGQGADEQLGGYKKFMGFYVVDRLRRGYFGQAASFIAGGVVNRTFSEFRLAESKRYVRWLRAAEPQHLSESVRASVMADNAFADSYEARELLDLQRFSLPALLNYEDKQSMAYSREVREPFLDHRVVELLAHVPPSAKLRYGWSKHILRTAFAADLPPEIAWRRDKRGFNVPEAHWCRGAFVPHFTRLLDEGLVLAEFGLVDTPAARGLLAAYVAGKRQVAYKDVLNLFLLEMFVRRFRPYLKAAHE
jgi:asparagine synthase (glutamine-hydrolysing)